MLLMKTYSWILYVRNDIGYGKIESFSSPLYDIQNKKIMSHTFSLICDFKYFVVLLEEISNDFKKMGCSFEIKGH